jgi:hypothetical protein
VSRRWDLLRPLIGAVLADCVLAPAQVVGKGGTLLVDGTIAPAWDWASVPDLYSGKAGYPGMNIQVAATLSGDVAAIGPVPVHGARHDAHAYAASGLKDLITGHDTIADLGYQNLADDLGRRRTLPTAHRQIRRDAQSCHRAILLQQLLSGS